MKSQYFRRLPKLVAEIVDVPLCLDSANHNAIAAALAVVPGKPLVNSVNGEEKSLEAVLPVVKEFGVSVIGLTMDDDGIPNNAETRIAIAEKILERAAKLGISADDIVIDPLVLTVGADSNAGSVTLKTIQMLREKFGVNINLGASNVSFGLPDRHTVNQAFLSLAMGIGATCAITDPIKPDQLDPGDGSFVGTRHIRRTLHRLLARASTQRGCLVCPSGIPKS